MSTASRREPCWSLPVETEHAATAFDVLAGIRVVDLTTSIAGPYATYLLADVGAEVLKVEFGADGDDSRAWGPPFLQGEALWYLAVNRNKRSLHLDSRSEADTALLRRLIERADVVVTNQRLPLLQRRGIDPDTLHQLRADLIHCSITGYGLTGPKRDAPGYDLIAEAAGGIMDLTGEPDSGPQKVGAPLADMLAGMDAAFAIATCLVDRDRTGRGHAIDISLLESMTKLATPQLMSYLGSGELTRRSGGRESVIAVYQAFSTADVPIVLALGNDRIFDRFCRAIGRADLADDPDYASNALRRGRRAELVAEIAVVLACDTAEHWLELCAAADVPAGPINTLEQVVNDEQLAARGMFYCLAGAVPIPQVNTGWHLDGERNRPRSAPPRLDADRDETLARWLNPVRADPSTGGELT